MQRNRLTESSAFMPGRNCASDEKCERARQSQYFSESLPKVPKLSLSVEILRSLIFPWIVVTGAGVAIAAAVPSCRHFSQERFSSRRLSSFREVGSGFPKHHTARNKLSSRD